MKTTETTIQTAEERVLTDIYNPETSTIIADAEIDQIPAGGIDPDRCDWKEAWYPVHYVRDLDKSKPIPFTLLDRNIVIWWDKKTESWVVFDDKCPHRLVPLSEGRITEDGLLECLDRGWVFSGSGKCDRISQQAEGRKAEKARKAIVPGTGYTSAKST